MAVDRSHPPQIDRACDHETPYLWRCRTAAGPLLRAALEGLHRTQYKILYTPLLSSLSEVLYANGRQDDALAVAEEALERVELNQSLSWLPEALRIKGEILLGSGRGQHEVVEELFRRSVDLAHA
jgi:hypothetical protein